MHYPSGALSSRHVPWNRCPLSNLVNSLYELFLHLKISKPRTPTMNTFIRLEMLCIAQLYFKKTRSAHRRSTNTSPSSDPSIFRDRVQLHSNPIGWILQSRFRRLYVPLNVGFKVSSLLNHIYPSPCFSYFHLPVYCWGSLHLQST